MRLYVGGRAQGKLALARQRHPNGVIWNELHLFVKEELAKGTTSEAIWNMVLKRMEETPDLIIISDEIGNGIVPMDKEERRYREETGRLLCKIAERAECVERVVCGIPIRIKTNLRLYLIRHGKTPGNEEKRYVGRTDESLSEKGREELLRNAFPKTELLFSSPMKRCIESCEVLFPGQATTLIEGFREIDFGTFEGKNYQELSGDPDYQAWIDSGGTKPFPKGEDRADFIRRNKRAFLEMLAQAMAYYEEHPEKEGKVAAVVHGGTIMSILSGFYGGDYFDYQIANGEAYLVTVEVTDGAVRILSAEKANK